MNTISILFCCSFGFALMGCTHTTTLEQNGLMDAPPLAASTSTSTEPARKSAFLNSPDAEASKFIEAIANDLLDKKGKFSANSEDGFYYEVNSRIGRYDFAASVQSFTFDDSSARACQNIGGTTLRCDRDFGGYISTAKSRHCEMSDNIGDYCVASYTVSWPGRERFEAYDVGRNAGAHAKEYHIDFTSSDYGAAIGLIMGQRLNANVQVYGAALRATATQDGDGAVTTRDYRQDDGADDLFSR